MRALTVILALLMAGVAAAALPPEHPKPIPQANQENAATADRPPQSIVVKLIPPQHLQVETTENAGERQHKDASDWWLVRLTGALAILGLIQAIIFGIQACVFRSQAKQLRRTVGEMKTATIATLKVAKALQKSARAWVLIETPIFRNSHPDVALDVDVMIKNYGQSPAFLTASFGALSCAQQGRNVASRSICAGENPPPHPDGCRQC